MADSDNFYMKEDNCFEYESGSNEDYSEGSNL